MRFSALLRHIFLLNNTFCTIRLPLPCTAHFILLLPDTDDDSSAVAMKEIMEILQSVKTQSRTVERRTCMTQLIRMTREGKTQIIQENFK